MVRRECGQQLRQGTQLHLEYRICNRDGSTGWVMHKSRVFLGENGQERMYTVLSDMSRTRAAYDEMHRRLESYEIILAQTENVLFEWDAEQDSVAYSETWETIFGYSPKTEHFLRDMKEHSHIHPKKQYQKKKSSHSVTEYVYNKITSSMNFLVILSQLYKK